MIVVLFSVNLRFCWQVYGVTHLELLFHFSEVDRCGNVFSVCHFSDPPSKPKSLEISDLTKSTVTLSWDRPDFDGGSPVTGYYIERRQAYSSRFTRINKNPISDTRYTVKNLVEDEEYEFRIVAENEAGTGKPSDTTGSFIAKDPYTIPDKPGKPLAVIEQGVALVTWDKPSSDGRSPITNYIVDMRQVGDVRWKTINIGKKVTNTEYSVSELKPDVEYEFRIIAENKAGQSQPSSTSKPAKFGK